MKKRLLLAAMAIICSLGTYALEIDDYAYTDTQRVKITGNNLVTNGDFANGTEGWTDAAGEAVNVEVWSFGEGLGPNGENVLTSLSGSTADAALCQKWDLDAGSYIVMYDIKGDATTATYLTPGGANNVDFFLTSTANPVYTRVDANDGTISVATPNGYKENWKTVAYYFEVGSGQSLVMHFEKLTANTMITNIQIYPAKEVYDARILENKLEFVNKLIATKKFTKDTENEFISNVVASVSEVLESQKTYELLSAEERATVGDGPMDDKNAIEGMMESYEDEFVAWLNANGADMLKDEKRWSDYGDTRKAFAEADFGGWDGTGGRWFHINNGGSNIITENGDEIGHRLQGGMAAGAASVYYPVTPKSAGTYMFCLDIVGHYMAGTGKDACKITNVAPNYQTDWNRDFKGVTMFAGKDIMGADATANEEMNIEQEGQKIDCGIISNPNPRNNAKRYVVFYEVSEADVAAATPIYFGITYIPDPERQGGSLGSNVNIAHPQIICIGETQEEADYKNEVAAIIVQQGPLKERLEWAKADLEKTAADYYAWGHTALQEAINENQALYDESINVVDESGNVVNEDFIRECLANEEPYSETLLAGVRAMNSARNAFRAANNAIFDYDTAVRTAEMVLNDLMNSSGSKAPLQAAISDAWAKLHEVLAITTEDTREADEATLAAQLELLAAAVEAFKASVTLEPIIDIDFSNKAESNPEGGYIINGAKGAMVFAEGYYSEDNSGAPWSNPDKGIGSMYFGQGIGEELLDVLRVGNGEGTVEVPADYNAESDILRFNFDVWFIRLSNGNLWVNLLNEAGQRVAGFKYLAYNDAETYNDFNNEANTGMDFNKDKSTPSNTTGDAGSCTDSNKSSFSLIVNYGAKTLQGIITSAKGTFTGEEVPFRTQDDEGVEIEDTKIVKYVLGSDYKNYPARRCWFDNLQALVYQGSVKGDVNGDSRVDVADITGIIAIMANNGYSQAADLNGDGAVDVADITGVIAIMAGTGN